VPPDPAAEGERAKPPLSHTAVHSAKAVPGSLAAHLPRIADTPECAGNFIDADTVTVIFDVQREDAAEFFFSLESDSDGPSLRVDGIPDQLDDRPERV